MLVTSEYTTFKVFEPKERLDLQIEYRDEPRVVFTGGKYLIQTIEKVQKDKFPFKTKICKNGEHLEFT